MARCILVLLVCVAATAFAEIVDIPNLGKVEGGTSTTAWSSRTVYEYKGIRYATAERFKEPVKAAPWTDTFDATQFAQKCPQPSFDRLGALASFMTPSKDAVYQQSRAAALADSVEDCLTLDVYTPTTDSSKKLPVLVYIHGGFFLWGSSATHGPGYLLEHDVVVVSIQYRLGPLGFMYLNDPNMPGNMALMDQIVALQWVKDNIGAFGGDSESVTIGGFSAGGGSVSLLMLSEEANGLFHKVLNQGGSALGIWAIDETVGVGDSKRVAELAGCSQLEIVDLIGCMEAKSVDDVINAYVEYSKEQRMQGILGTGGAMPVIQETDNGYTVVIKETPLTTLMSGTYEARPLLTGTNKHEGIFALDYIHREFLEPNDLLENADFLKNDFVKVLLNTYHVKESSQTFSYGVTKRYFNESDLGDYKKMVNGLIDLSGAEFLKSPWYKQCDLHSLNTPDVYMYGWHYNGRYSLMQNTNNTLPIVGGITHGDDTIFIFPNEKYPLNSNEAAVSKRLVQAIFNFMSTGNPTPDGEEIEGLPKWEKFERSNAYYIEFSDEATIESQYRYKFTVARDEGIQEHSLAVASIASPLLILATVLYHMLQ